MKKSIRLELKKKLEGISLKNFLLLTLAGIINAFGVTVFIAPVKLYDSGISGTSMLLSQITPEWMTLSFFLLLLNIPMFIYGLKKQGFAFTVYAVYTVSVYSLVAWLITDVLPVDVNIASPLAGEDLLLCALFGGMISGLGSGLAIRFGGAMDGIEVMSVIYAKRLGITVGTFVMIFNLILYVVAGIIIKSWTLPLYSIVTYMASLKTVDFVVEGVDRSKSVLIVTSFQEDVCRTLSSVFRQGITVINAKGYYSDTEKKIVYIVLNRFQIMKMKDIVHTIDPQAYILISEVADVFKSNQNENSIKTDIEKTIEYTEIQ